MTDFDCARFTAWLDQGSGAGQAPAAAAHAAACAGCAEAWEDERAVRRLLAPGAAGAGRAAAGPGFAERVMARVALTPQAHAAVPLVPAAGFAAVLPWWVRAAAQPASALGLALAGLATFFAPQLRAASVHLPAAFAGLETLLVSGLGGRPAGLAGPAGDHPLLGFGLALAVLPLVLLVAVAGYRLGAALTTARFAPAVALPMRSRGRRA